MLRLTCKKHPRYKANISPKANCEQCIFIWETKIKAERERVDVS